MGQTDSHDSQEDNYVNLHGRVLGFISDFHLPYKVANFRFSISVSCANSVFRQAHHQRSRFETRSLNNKKKNVR
ncbi:hypothetical protein F0562_023137 [Nyssa sinensis]|uniref:Uncharacterized protein n=1 Tax=Nyssa sinensis TaxID=561372 RepID=A0A5J5BFX3_9ASTE|nr:hypothetical protein F0562_023137 [Nyssa sinensis]